MEHAAVASTSFVAQIGVKGDEHEVPPETVLDNCLVILVGQTNVSSATYAKAPAVNQARDRLDHVLVGEKL